MLIVICILTGQIVTLYLLYQVITTIKKNNNNYSNMNNYTNYNLVNVFNNFINNYKTKGNMKLLNESFQRQMIVKNFKQWFIANIKAFVEVTVLRPISQSQTIDFQDSNIENDSLQKKDS
jgi:hypothetical protein